MRQDICCVSSPKSFHSDINDKWPKRALYLSLLLIPAVELPPAPALALAPVPTLALGPPGPASEVAPRHISFWTQFSKKTKQVFGLETKSKGNFVSRARHAARTEQVALTLKRRSYLAGQVWPLQDYCLRLPYSVFLIKC